MQHAYGDESCIQDISGETW